MNRRPLIAAGVIMGIGMGGFVDGILFHQIFQIHNMLSARLPPTSLVNVETTMVWDGLFHVRIPGQAERHSGGKVNRDSGRKPNTFSLFPESRSPWSRNSFPGKRRWT